MGKCLSCRRHFLEQFDNASYDLRLAKEDTAALVLYFWRFHNAVSVRVAAEHSCNEVDRRWPPLSLCPRCWDVGASSDWDVLREAKDLSGGDNSPMRAVRLGALPNEMEIFRFLMAAFTGSSADLDKAVKP